MYLFLCFSYSASPPRQSDGAHQISQQKISTSCPVLPPVLSASALQWSLHSFLRTRQSTSNVQQNTSSQLILQSTMFLFLSSYLSERRPVAPSRKLGTVFRFPHLPYPVISVWAILSPEVLFQFVLFSVSPLQQLAAFFLPKLLTVLFHVLQNSAVQQKYVVLNSPVTTLKKVKLILIMYFI